jgi:hypothetical protein
MTDRISAGELDGFGKPKWINNFSETEEDKAFQRAAHTIRSLSSELEKAEKARDEYRELAHTLDKELEKEKAEFKELASKKYSEWIEQHETCVISSEERLLFAENAWKDLLDKSNAENVTLKRQKDELVKAAKDLIPYVSYADYCDVCGTGKCDSCSVRAEFEGAIDSVNCTINSLGSGE